MPGAIGWAPALLPSRGGVIARPRFNPGPCALRLGDRGSRRSRGRYLASRRRTSALRQARSACEVQVLPPCQFFGHTGSALALAAGCQISIYVNAWTNDPGAARREGIDLARRALRVAGDDACVLANAAWAFGLF